MFWYDCLQVLSCGLISIGPPESNINDETNNILKPTSCYTSNHDVIQCHNHYSSVSQESDSNSDNDNEHATNIISSFTSSFTSPSSSEGKSWEFMDADTI